jgi:hypothetical protein
VKQNLYLFYTIYNPKNAVYCSVIINGHFYNLYLLLIREKHGLVRNDFLDSMMELRKRDEDEVQGEVRNDENANKGPNFRKI